MDQTLKEVCLEISKRYEMHLGEIGTDKDHVHFLIQSVPKYGPSGIIRTIKSITAKLIFEKHPEAKKMLWGGEFWSDGYFVSTVGKHGNEKTITTYVQEQGREQEYKKMHCDQLRLF